MSPVRIFFATLAMLALGGGATAAVHSPAKPKPVLVLRDRAPLTVSGVYFKARERVRVTAATQKHTVVRLTRTTRRGSFVVRLGAPGADSCGRITITAVGARGDRARLVIQPRPPIEGGPCIP